jgi:hypothetical protein
MVAWVPSRAEAWLGAGLDGIPHDRFTGFPVNGAKGVARGLHAFVIVQGLSELIPQWVFYSTRPLERASFSHIIGGLRFHLCRSGGDFPGKLVK